MSLSLLHDRDERALKATHDACGFISSDIQDIGTARARSFWNGRVEYVSGLLGSLINERQMRNPARYLYILNGLVKLDCQHEQSDLMGHFILIVTRGHSGVERAVLPPYTHALTDGQVFPSHDVKEFGNRW